MLLEVRFGSKVVSSAPNASEHAAGDVMTPLVKVSAILKWKFAKRSFIGEVLTRGFDF